MMNYNTYDVLVYVVLHGVILCIIGMHCTFIQAHWRSEIEQLLEDQHREVISLQGNTELIRKRQEELK